MAVFKAFDSNVEVNGETVLSVVDGMGAFKQRAYQIMKENGIDNPEPGKWYPQQAWLDAFKAISQNLGSNVLYKIGKSIPENAQFPPDIDSIEKGLSLIDVAYHMNHRNGEIGSYKFEKTSDRSGKMICNNPYPTDFDRGIIEAMGTKFKPADSKQVRVMLDQAASGRSSGGDTDIYNVEW